jgi:hypothetical protein
MILTIHRRDYGVTPDGTWHQKIGGEWITIPQPEWSKKKISGKVVDLHMAPPKEKTKISMVTVYKVTQKTVPDYEAEVLCRNGWQDYYPGTLRNYDSSELSAG